MQLLRKATQEVIILETKQYVVNTDMLNVRDGAGYDFRVCGILHNGELINVLSEIQEDGEIWGQIENRFICLKYCEAVK